MMSPFNPPVAAAGFVQTGFFGLPGPGHHARLPGPAPLASGAGAGCVVVDVATTCATEGYPGNTWNVITEFLNSEAGIGKFTGPVPVPSATPHRGPIDPRSVVAYFIVIDPLIE